MAAVSQGVGEAIPGLFTAPGLFTGSASILRSLAKGGAEKAGEEWLNDHAATQEPQKLAAMDSGYEVILNPDDRLAWAQFLVNFLQMDNQNASQPGN